jgi:acyl dehydratase
MIVFNGIDEIRAHVGETLGPSQSVLITQKMIDAFATTTADMYWIHTDPQRAATDTEFGGTIAHGLLTLSLGPRFSYELYEITGIAVGLNYGYGKVRFPAPLPVGSELRMTATLASCDAVPGGALVTFLQTFERVGHDKPVCVAEALLRLVTGEPQQPAQPSE